MAASTTPAPGVTKPELYTASAPEVKDELSSMMSIILDNNKHSSLTGVDICSHVLCAVAPGSAATAFCI
jgi:hypothetical protein